MVFLNGLVHRIQQWILFKVYNNEGEDCYILEVDVEYLKNT